MSIRHLLFLLFTIGLCHAADPALKDTPLTAIKGSMQIPDGWFVNESTDDGVTVYQFTKEKVESANDTFSTGLILTVTPKVQERAQMKASEYASEMMEATADDPKAIKKSTDGDWQVFRSESKLEADGGDITMVNYAKANDTTGTLYFVTWQSPASDEAKMASVREAVLSSLKFDPSF